MSEPVHKYGAFVSVSAEALVETEEDAASFYRWMNATPEERLRWIREAQARRDAEQRATAEAVPLTLDALLDKLGFSREYAEHLVQPYCYCGDSHDGWDYCQHALDLGFGS